MSFLSKNWAGLLVCLIISIISWVLGGFLPVVGAPVFAIFIGMILYPFLTSYKQLDAGLTYSSKIASVCCYLAWFRTQYFSSFRSWKIFPSCHPFDHFYRFNYCFLFQRFFNLDTKLATLIGVGSSICGGSAIAATAPVIHAKEKKCPSHFCYLFLQCLGSSYLSNSRFLAPSLQRRFCSLCGYCGQRYFLCNSHS